MQHSGEIFIPGEIGDTTFSSRQDCEATLQVAFGALPISERIELLHLGTAKMPMAPDLNLNTVAEAMRCARTQHTLIQPHHANLPAKWCIDATSSINEG